MPLLEPVRPLVLLDEFWLPELPYAPLDVPDVPLVSCELEPCADWLDVPLVPLVLPVPLEPLVCANATVQQARAELMSIAESFLFMSFPPWNLSTLTPNNSTFGARGGRSRQERPRGPDMLWSVRPGVTQGSLSRAPAATGRTGAGLIAAILLRTDLGSTLLLLVAALVAHP